MVQASAERVWRLLTTPSELHHWSDAKSVNGPDRPLAKGDQVVFRAGPGSFFEIRFRVIDLERLRRLALDVHLPFGIVNHEIVIITPESDSACRVTYN
jgi:uncharacterized protein YndB with AHSA1/START domain